MSTVTNHRHGQNSTVEPPDNYKNGSPMVKTTIKRLI